MTFSQAYSEMQQQVSHRSSIDGQRSFPALCMEIYLLSQAQQKIKRNDEALFGQLVTSVSQPDRSPKDR